MLNKNINSLIVMSVLLTTLMSSNNVVNATELSVTDQNRLLGAVPREWESANLREWLNSDKANVNYTSIAPSYKNEAGFLSDENFTQSEREAIAITKHGGAYQYSIGNTNDTKYISQRGVAHNDYIYNDKVFILNYTDLLNYIERNKQLMNLNTKYYSDYLKSTTNKQNKYPYIVNSGYVNGGYAGTNQMYSSTLTTLAGKSQNNIVPALSLKPDYVLSNGVKASDLTVGQTVIFGRYNGEPIEWQVINVSTAGYPLLWSTKIIAIKEYDAPGDINPLKSDHINFNTYDVDIASGTGQNKSWETQQEVTSYPVIAITNESALTTPTNDSQITIQIKVTDTKNKSIRSITLPNGTVVNGDTASYTLTKNGEFDIIAENEDGIISVRHVVTKAINTPAEVTITTDKSNSSKWTNKPVNVTVSATNNGVYTKTTNAKPTGYGSVSTSTYPNWMPLGGKRIRVTGTLYNKITDEDIEKYKVDMNAVIRLRINYIQYTTNNLGWNYPLYKSIKLSELKEAGSIEIDEILTIPNNAYSTLNVAFSLMDSNSPYMKPGYNWGASPFIFEILDKDDLKIEEITMPDGNIVKSDSAKYQVFEAGSYKFSAKDNRGKVTSKTIDIAIDMVNPQADITYNENLTKENVTLQINATDDLSGVKSISLPNGEKRTNNIEGRPLSINYNITENGTYRFTITDFADNQITKTVNVTNIDKTAPTINVAGNPTEWTKNDATLTVTATDTGSGVKSITLPDGRVVNGSSATYTVSANGDYTFRVTDNVGNVLTHVVNVTKIDKIKSTINISGSPESLNNQNVKLTINATDNESGIKSITLPNGKVVNETSTTYIVNQNGNYKFTVTDHAGNETTQTVNIDIPVLTSQDYPNKDMIKLDWTLNNANDKTFKVYQKKPGSNEFQTISATNYDDNDNVKVLNVYPPYSITETYTTWKGETVTLPISASLKKWLEEPNSESDKGYGKGIISVDAVLIDYFNLNPDTFLKNTDGTYKYDVIMFGSYDSNGGRDLSKASLDATKEFIDSGRGVLFGHDTVSQWYGRANFPKLESYINVKTYPFKETVNWKAPDKIWIMPWSGGTEINVTKKGALTNYPWVVGDIGTKLTVPYTHTNSQVAKGDVWMKFTNPKSDSVSNVPVDTNEYSDNGEGTNMAYLTTYNNTAMIQTGHAINRYSATPDEQKILANTLFYLNQLSNETYLEDYSGQDVSAPNTPKINGYSFTSDGYVNFTFNNVTDNGSTYEYYVESTSKDSEVTVKSNTVTDTITSGIKGYSYVVDNNATTIPDDIIEQSDNKTIKHKYSNTNNLYVHIKAIDNVGNVSETYHYKLTDNTKPVINISQNPTTWTNGNVTIQATATDTGSGVKHITLPDGKIVNGSSATYTVTSNGEYIFKATDYVGNETIKVVNITNIDKAGPVISYTLTPNTWTRGNVTINLNVTDLGAGFKEIHMPNGTIVSTPTASYTVSKNGVYYFKAVDKLGNETILPILVTNIDVKAPSLNINNNQNWTNQNVQIDIAGSDK